MRVCIARASRVHRAAAPPTRAAALFQLAGAKCRALIDARARCAARSIIAIIGTRISDDKERPCSLPDSDAAMALRSR